MSNLHTLLLDAVPAGVVQKTRVVDTLLVVTASMQFTLTGATTPSIAIVLQGSNAVPPNGAKTNNTTQAWGSQPWEVPESSWVQIYSGSAPISSTMVADGTMVLGVAADGLLMRWLRAVATPSTGHGGALTVECFARDTGS